MKIDNIINEIFEEEIVSLTFSNPFKKSEKFKKITIDNIDNMYTISEYSETQVFHKHLSGFETKRLMHELFETYKQLDGKVVTGNYNIRVNKKGNVLRRFSAQTNQVIESHNRSKNYILSNYKEMEILKDLKIVSHDNEIISTMFDKFKQINKYVELVDDLIKNDDLEKLKIVDFGSGKSYLTFALYEYLVNVKQIEVEVYGIDLKESVIKDNQALAEKYGYKNLNFIHGDINDIEIDNVDMMISLHACDIATDLALNKALAWKVKYIVVVPCCQNELYKQLKSDQFEKMLDFNIIKERMSALITDTVRSNVLQYKGYNTQVIEYIDSSHSLKNLMIRARFTNHTDHKALDNIIELQNTYNFNQKLLELQNIGLKK